MIRKPIARAQWWPRPADALFSLGVALFLGPVAAAAAFASGEAHSGRWPAGGPWEGNHGPWRSAGDLLMYLALVQIAGVVVMALGSWIRRSVVRGAVAIAAAALLLPSCSFVFWAAD